MKPGVVDGAAVFLRVEAADQGEQGFVDHRDHVFFVDATAQVDPSHLLDVAAAADLTLESTEDGHQHASESPAQHAEQDKQHDHAGNDPHFWLDPLRYAAVARAIGLRLAADDPARAAAYSKNTDAFVAKLTALDRDYRTGLKACTHKVIVTSHSAFGYLAQRYGLDQHGIAGLSPEVEPSAAPDKASANGNQWGDSVGDSLGAGGLGLSGIGEGGGGERSRNPNTQSCVLRIASQQGAVALLVGDIEKAQERALLERQAAIAADVLLVPHHGSKTSSSAPFLDAVQPRVALVQAAYRSRFWHPAAEVMQRYHQRGIAVWDSARCGAATWQSIDPAQVLCEREQQRRYWQHRID